MTGYLPIHCVCQLLKSRAFSKHNVSIAEWVINQVSFHVICQAADNSVVLCDSFQIAGG